MDLGAGNLGWVCMTWILPARAPAGGDTLHPPGRAASTDNVGTIFIPATLRDGRRKAPTAPFPAPPIG